MNEPRDSRDEAADTPAAPQNSNPSLAPGSTEASTPPPAPAAGPSFEASAPAPAPAPEPAPNPYLPIAPPAGVSDAAYADAVRDAAYAETRRRKRRTRKVAAFAVAGALVLAGGTGATAFALGRAFPAGDSTVAAGSPGSFGNGSAGDGSTGSGSTTDPFGNGFPGSGGSGSGSSGTDPFGGGAQSGSSSTSGTAATASQSVGVVTIVSTLKYQQAEAAGTGIILTSSGEILTNNHVVEGSTSLTVTDESTGKEYTATVVGTDATDDVAVLQLQNASGLTTAKISSTDAATGDAVTAVGNAGGTGTLTQASGTVTALDQSITTQAEGSAASEDLTGLIQVDADIVAGDSGGPLQNSDGEVVGIDTAASSGTQNVTGFAIPIDDALDIATQIIAGRASDTIRIGYPAFLGVSVSPSTQVAGAGVAQVIDGTPAAGSGLAAGDVITAVDGTQVASGSALTSVLGGYSPGDSVTITYTDASGATQSTQVTLTQGPAA